jgi:hypothetical protein
MRATVVRTILIVMALNIGQRRRRLNFMPHSCPVTPVLIIRAVGEVIPGRTSAPPQPRRSPVRIQVDDAIADHVGPTIGYRNRAGGCLPLAPPARATCGWLEVYGDVMKAAFIEPAEWPRSTPTRWRTSGARDQSCREGRAATSRMSTPGSAPSVARLLRNGRFRRLAEARLRARVLLVCALKRPFPSARGQPDPAALGVPSALRTAGRPARSDKRLDASDRLHQSVSCLAFKLFDGTARGFWSESNDHK